MWRGAHTGSASRRVTAALALPLLLAFACVPAARAAIPAHGRAWELVTTGPTNGAPLFGARAWSGDGTHVVYQSLGPMPGAPAGDIFALGQATRGADGWVKQPLGEPYTLTAPELQTTDALAIDDSFASSAWRSDRPLLPDAPAAPETAYYRRATDGTLTLLGAVGSIGESRFVTASADTQHLFFQSSAHLLPGDAGRVAGSDGYEFAGSQLRLVGVDDAGAALSACGSFVGDGFSEDDVFTHPVSRDGARVWVTAPATSGCAGPSRVYLRTNGTHTVEASASACTRPDCGPPADVHFAGAAPDGSAAFLITEQQLTDDDTDTTPDLYRYDVASHALTRLSRGAPGVAANVLTFVVASSDDGTRVWFIASGALVPGEGVEGRRNLYASDHGTVHFVATVNSFDLHRAVVSADGRAIAFATAEQLLPSDIDQQIDVYRYDERVGVLQQVSLGAGGRGNEPLDVTFATSPDRHPLRQEDTRWLSADGQRVVFVTAEPLVPEDVNATPDVYEWVDGTLGLVSSGAGDSTLAYDGMSADGSSVFFSTDESLVPEDRDGGDGDLYVARLGGGFPSPPPAGAPCDGDACQGALGVRLLRPLPPTLGHVEPPPLPLRIRPLTHRARARLAVGGQVLVAVDVPTAGRVSLLVRARIDGHTVRVARAAATPRGAGAVRLRVRLGAAALRILHGGHPLRLTLVLRQADARAVSSLTIQARRRS